MQRRILIVEDNPDAMRLLREMLHGGDYEVVQAYGAEDALRKVKLRRPHLIVTDLAMPKMSGAELADAVRRDPETQLIPILAITAYAWDYLARAAEELGCDEVLSKPFKREELLKAVARCLRGSALGDDQPAT